MSIYETKSLTMIKDGNIMKTKLMEKKHGQYHFLMSYLNLANITEKSNRIEKIEIWMHTFSFRI